MNLCLKHREESKFIFSLKKISFSLVFCHQAVENTKNTNWEIYVSLENASTGSGRVRDCMKPSGLGSFTLTLKSQRAVLDSFMNIQEDFADFSSLDDNCQQAVINSFYVNLYWCHTKNSDLPWNILSNILGSIITELWFPFNYKYNYFSLLWTFCQYNYLSGSHTKNKYSSVTVSNHVISL